MGSEIRTCYNSPVVPEEEKAQMPVVELRCLGETVAPIMVYQHTGLPSWVWTTGVFII